MEGRTAVRPSGITPDFHAAFKQTWYNTGVGAMGLKRGRPVQFHWPLVGPQKGRLPLLVPWGLGPAPRGLATAP